MPSVEVLNPTKVLKLAGLEYGFRTADLGCGAGFFALCAAKMVGDKGQVYAVDVLKSALLAVESKARLVGLTNLKTVWSNLEIYGATKIPEGTLDLALVINVLYQSKKHGEIFREAGRLLKGNGKMLVVDWKKEKSPFGPPVLNRVDKEKVKTIAREAGFTFEKEIIPGPYHFGFIFRRS